MTDAVTTTELTPTAVIEGLTGLAHETRLAVFRLLVRRGSAGETAGELARRLDVPPQTLSFHLKEMTRAGLVVGRREGRNIFYAVAFDHVTRLIAYLSDSCCVDAPQPVTVTRRPARRRSSDD